ncbi:MAG TPA: WXG100 family type VII secretion target [Aggregatilineales bacterium]|nr:WXG100 family type VII secretion target [Anaerolineales bacterium]HRE46781.1 WXG100 family type VII secretion target [Aggregatilineales bacterium]
MSVFTFVANEIVEQINTYKGQGEQCDRVVSQIKTGVQPIQGGAWKGQGARAYIGVIIGQVIPHIIELIAAITGFGGNLGKALNIMNQADKMVSGIVGQVSDMFDQVF